MSYTLQIRQYSPMPIEIVINIFTRRMLIFMFDVYLLGLLAKSTLK